ncbi:MAG: hypothetical protein CVU91_08245 [Firmicutes bacterium HGW-Firmicutes-16]|nr:MAG: hypothetical protein CVU91_08245 [Firmicutes bacterium HGW-Firmicutes-16]
MEKASAKTVLFDKAMELFRSDGYDNVTIQQICRKSNVTRNAFYYYFDSKEGLLSSYFENIPRFTETLLADVLALPCDWEKLRYIIEAHLKLAESEGLSVCRAFVKVSMDGNGDLLAKYYVSENVTIPLVRSCQNSGAIGNMTEPGSLVYLATRLLLGVLVTWCCKNGEFDLIAVSMEAFRSLMQPVL